jgi:hypothetical protein|tara:strand:+ start:297 stop:482 length:186 start_codon:yes stop_codon:yes gene_type:complete
MSKHWEKERFSVAYKLLDSIRKEKLWLKNVWRNDKLNAIKKIDSLIKKLAEIREEIIRMRS